MGTFYSTMCHFEILQYTVWTWHQISLTGLYYKTINRTMIWKHNINIIELWFCFQIVQCTLEDPPQQTKLPWIFHGQDICERLPQWHVHQIASSVFKNENPKNTIVVYFLKAFLITLLFSCRAGVKVSSLLTARTLDAIGRLDRSRLCFCQGRSLTVEWTRSANTKYLSFCSFCRWRTGKVCTTI